MSAFACLGMTTKIAKVTKSVVPMTDSAANLDERKRHSAFKRGDVLIFVVFPIALILGFLLFLWWPKTPADPNLRLVAQVTDDISVELVAVARQDQSIAGPKIWWKPNGLPAPEVKENAAGKTTGGPDPGFCFLYHLKDKRPGKNTAATAVAGTSGSSMSETLKGSNGKQIILFTDAKPDFWNSVNAGVRISTEGDQYVGELTPGNAKLSTLVGGRAATIEVLSGKALTDVTKYLSSPCALEITEARRPEWKINSMFSIEVYDEAGKKDPSVSMQSLSMQVGQQRNENHHLYYFNCVTWSRIVIHRTVYDAHVTFESVSAQLNALTSPRIGEVSNVRKK